MSFSIAQDNNIGSIGQLKLSPAYNITTLNPVTFTNGNNWEPVDFIDEKAQLIEEIIDTDNGTQYTYVLTITFNKKRQDLFNSIIPYLGIVAIALVTDNNGLSQIIGNLQSPLTFKQNSDTGMGYADMNNVVITATVVQDSAAITVADASA